MSDKLLEGLALVLGGIVLFVVAENNLPQIKKVISNISPQISRYIPVSTLAPRGPIPQSKHCPPGMYADFTDGILTCVDPHGTRELQNLQGGSPIYNAWGLDQENYPGTAHPGQPGQNLPGQCINCTTPGQPGIGGQAGAPGITWGWASDRQQDINAITQTGIPKSIAKETLPPTKKQIEKEKDKERKKHKKKLAQIPDDHQVHAQIECHDNLPCGSNCYKDGKLWKIVCSEQERESLYPPKRKKQPSLTIPPNFPNQVIITPGETPYPDEDVGGTAPPDRIGQTNPDFNPPPTSDDTTTVTPPITGVGLPFYPFTVWKGFAGAVDGCRQTSGFKTCRVVASDQTMRSHIGNNGYRIDAVVDVGEHDGGRNQEMSITSAGPGSDPNMCCGFTVRINLNNGSMRLENEDWAHNYDGKHRTTSIKYWEGDSISNGRSVYGNKGVQLSWIAVKGSDGSVTYHGEGSLPGGRKVVTPSLKNPQAYPGGPTLSLFNKLSGNKSIDDAHRVRCDCAKTVNFNNPKVTVLPVGSYYGELGYIHRGEDLLI